MRPAVALGARGWSLLFLASFGACAASAADRHPDTRVPPPTSAPAVDAAAEPPDRDADREEDAAQLPESPAASRQPRWASGSVTDRLHALRVNDDDWARRDLVSWTTPPQVDAMRASRVLLVATANMGGPPSPFVWLVSRLARRSGPAGALAGVLANDPRFLRRRYAWSAGYPTVLGLSGKRYGNELVAVRLRADALVVALAPERDPPVSVRDLDQNEIPLDRARDEAGRIGAVYHVRTGTDVPARFREYVLVNEAAIERWAVGTPDVHAEIEAEEALLRDLQAQLGPSPPAARAPRPLAAWRHLDAASPLRALWEGTLAFPSDRYVLDAERLAVTLSALAEYDRSAPELEVRP
jgi:hypothetical protein